MAPARRPAFSTTGWRSLRTVAIALRRTGDDCAEVSLPSLCHDVHHGRVRRPWLYFAIAALFANVALLTNGGNTATAVTSAYLDPLLRSVLSAAAPDSSLVAIAELAAV